MKKLLFTAVLLTMMATVVANADDRLADLPMTIDLEWINNQNIPLQNGRPMISFDKQDRPVIDLGGVWKKKRLAVNHNFSLTKRDAAWLEQVENETNGATHPGFDDSDWATHTLPGVENEMPPTPDHPDGAEVYGQGVYYRRHVAVPADWEGRVVRLITLSADYVADVWVNGVWIGYHEGGYGPFAFDVSSELNYGGDNVIVYRIDAMPWLIRLDIIPTWFATDWQHYVGIVQDVYLEAAPAVNIVRTDVLPKTVQGDIDVSIVVENQGAVNKNILAEAKVFTINDQSPDYLTEPVVANLLGDPVAITGSTQRYFELIAGDYTRKSFKVQIPDPTLWTPAEPSLYVMQITIRDGDEVLDAFATQFGVRTVRVGDGAKILLNRRPTFFTGMARHEDWPDSGRTATMEKIAEDLQIIRDTNVWFLRTAHYPNHPDTYLLTDRLGFAVWEEIPAWWIMQFTIPILLERGLAVQMWREMIWTGRNRPSILFWSLCNEPMWYLAFNLRDYVQTVHADLDDNYPDGRLVTQSLAADGAILTGSSQQDVDVAGWTMYFGVFYGDDIAGETADFLERQHQRYPDIPIIATEYGYWSSDKDLTQTEVVDQTLEGMLPYAAVDPDAITTEGFLAGVTYWCQFNWYRVQDPHVQKMGIMLMDRETPKAAYPTLVDHYAPYFNSGGLGDEIPPDDDTYDDDTFDDDIPVDDDDNEDNDDNDAIDDDDNDVSDDDDDDNDDGCGC